MRMCVHTLACAFAHEKLTLESMSGDKSDNRNKTLWVLSRPVCEFRVTTGICEKKI